MTKEEKISFILKTLDDENVDYSFNPEDNTVTIWEEWETFDLDDEAELELHYDSALKASQSAYKYFNQQ